MQVYSMRGRTSTRARVGCMQHVAHVAKVAFRIFCSPFFYMYLNLKFFGFCALHESYLL